MTSSNHYDDFILRDIKREIAHHERLHPKQQSQKPPAPEPTIHFLDQVPDKPLTWLWPGRIPFGHLTLLDAAPGSGLSLVALTLAACVSSGSPRPLGYSRSRQRHPWSLPLPACPRRARPPDQLCHSAYPLLAPVPC